MAERITIKTDYITLAQLLKLADLIATGGQAKAFLASEPVLVNQEREQRRGKKLYPGDRVSVAGQDFVLAHMSAADRAEAAEQAAILARFQKKTQQTRQPANKKPSGPGSWN
ncbi:S4 domain-containing protein YaaA [Leuconostocaceae bacterium ESL0958]|nr:S4 domain-containing protein YaaA [Leuconostocaceae bacterium ESL0958]